MMLHTFSPSKRETVFNKKVSCIMYKITEINHIIHISMIDYIIITSVAFQKRKKGPISYAPLYAASERKARNIKEARKGETQFQKTVEGQMYQVEETYPSPSKIVKVNRQSNYYLRSEPMMLERNASSLISMKHQFIVHLRYYRQNLVDI